MSFKYKKGSPHRSTSHGKKSRFGKPFIADVYTKELKNAKFDSQHIARYGKGFSNLIQIAGQSEPQIESQLALGRHRNEESLYSPDEDEVIMNNGQVPASYALYRPEVK